MGHNIIALTDVHNDVNIQIENNEFYLDMTEFFVNTNVIDSILKHKKPVRVANDNQSEDITILDLFNIPFEDDEEIKKFIRLKMGIDIDTDDGITKINNLFSQTIRLYEERYLRKLPPKFKNSKFNSATSIINFLKETKTNKKRGLINCAIAKIAFSMNDVLSSEKVRRANFIENCFLDELAIPLQITESYERNGVLFRKGKVAFDNGKIVNFQIIVRMKKISSVVGKEVATAKYYAVEKFKDIVGATFYIGDVEGALQLMQYLDQSVYKGNSDISITGHDLNEESSDLFNQDFAEKILKAIEEKEENERKGKNKGTSGNFLCLKLTGDVDLPLEEGQYASRFPIGAEIQFVVGDHDNEYGLSLHSIYDYKKKFRELTRLGIPIRKLDILNYVNDFFENIDFYLSKKNKEKGQFLEELKKDLIEENLLDNIENPTEKDLAIGLYRHFERFLKKVRVGNMEFYVEERALKLRDLGMHRKDLQELKEAA